MSIENWSDNVILVNLARQPETVDELIDVDELARDRGNCDVVIDCSGVQTLTALSRSRLISLRRSLNSVGHELILCNPSEATRETLDSTGLATVLKLANDKFSALTDLQLSG
mgnify:CR=1 FL=1